MAYWRQGGDLCSPAQVKEQQSLGQETSCIHGWQTVWPGVQQGIVLCPILSYLSYQHIWMILGLTGAKLTVMICSQSTWCLMLTSSSPSDPKDQAKYNLQTPSQIFHLMSTRCHIKTNILVVWALRTFRRRSRFLIVRKWEPWTLLLWTSIVQAQPWLLAWNCNYYN